MLHDKQLIKLSKMRKDLFARQFSYQEVNKRGNIENVLSAGSVKLDTLMMKQQ
jgi:hypothetical protein